MGARGRRHLCAPTTGGHNGTLGWLLHGRILSTFGDTAYTVDQMIEVSHWALDWQNLT